MFGEHGRQNAVDPRKEQLAGAQILFVCVYVGGILESAVVAKKSGPVEVSPPYLEVVPGICHSHH